MTGPLDNPLDDSAREQLTWQPWYATPDLVAAPVAAALTDWSTPTTNQVDVASIDPELADTAAFCDRYGVDPGASANCVVVAGRRGEATRYAACLVLATTRADVNGVVRKRLDARKASFAPLDDAVAATGMEYGGITPIGLPSDWPIYVDTRVAALPWMVIGAGVRAAKLALSGATLVAYPGVEVVDGLAG